MAPREGYKLASFKLPEDLIERLKTEAERRNTSQTALLVDGLEYILGMASDAVGAVPDIDQRIDRRIDQRIDSAISPLASQLEEIKASLGKSNLKLSDFVPDR